MICKNDIKGYPEYNPNLACVCIAKEFRKQGYSKILMQYANSVIENMQIKKAYLKTDLTNFYEKFGWKFLKEIKIDDKFEKIYKKKFLNNKKNDKHKLIIFCFSNTLSNCAI